MADFAKLVLKTDLVDNVQRYFVENLIVVDDSIPAGNGTLADNPKHVDGENYCSNLFGGMWKQSFSGKEFRKNGASIGGFYDADKDIFVAERPHNSWVLNSNGDDWQPPIPVPTEEQKNGYTIYWLEDILTFEGFDSQGNMFTWNADTLTWNPK